MALSTITLAAEHGRMLHALLFRLMSTAFILARMQNPCLYRSTTLALMTLPQTLTTLAPLTSMIQTLRCFQDLSILGVLPETYDSLGRWKGVAFLIVAQCALSHGKRTLRDRALVRGLEQSKASALQLFCKVLR